MQTLDLKITVVDMEVPTLLGREWLTYLQLDWHRLFPVKKANSVAVHTLQNLKEKCPEMFNDKGEVTEGLSSNITLEEVRSKLNEV